MRGFSPPEARGFLERNNSRRCSPRRGPNNPAQGRAAIRPRRPGYQSPQPNALQGRNNYEGISAAGQRLLLDQINSWNGQYSASRPGDSRLDARIANYELAFRMQSAAPELIDLSRETEATRDVYHR